MDLTNKMENRWISLKNRSSLFKQSSYDCVEIGLFLTNASVPFKMFGHGVQPSGITLSILDLFRFLNYMMECRSCSFRHRASSVFWDVINLCVIAFFIYMIYKCCIATPTPAANDQPPSYEDTFRQQGSHGNQQPPPPYGFRQEYMPGSNTGGMCLHSLY